MLEGLGVEQLLERLKDILGKMRLSNQEYFTLEEAADYLRCDPVTLKNLHRNKQIAYFRLGGERRYRRKDLDSLVTKRLMGISLNEETVLIGQSSQKKYRLKKDGV